MLKTILAVALFSIGAHAQQQILPTQNINLSKLQSIQMQREAVAMQRLEVAQDRQFIDATEQALTRSKKDTSTAAGGVRFGQIVSGGAAIVYGVPIIGRLWLDSKALFQGAILPEQFMKSLSLKQVVLGLGSVAAIFAVDRFDNLYVAVQEAQWPETQMRLQQKRQDLLLKEHLLRNTELSLQQKIQSLGQ